MLDIAAVEIYTAKPVARIPALVEELKRVADAVEDDGYFADLLKYGNESLSLLKLQRTLILLQF